MRIVVMGAGAVGGLLGGLLALSGAEVALVARGAQLEALRERGLRLTTSDAEHVVSLAATDDPAEIGACDLVLFCVKSHDTAVAAARLGPLLGEATAVLSLQNGIDNEARISAAVGAERVLGGAAFVLATVSEPGVVTLTGPPPRVVIGELDGSRSARGEQITAALAAAGVRAELSEDVRAVLWRKFAFICALAGMTAATRVPIGAVREAPASWAMFRRLVEEVCATAAAEGVDLPARTADELVSMGAKLDPAGRSSLYHDLAAGRRLELDALHGTVWRLARRHGLDVPMCEAVYAVLQPLATPHGEDGTG